MGKAAIRRKVLCFVLIIAWGRLPCFAEDQDAWKQLKLDATRIAGATVYYEKCFEQNLPFFKKAYKQFLEGSVDPNTIFRKNDKIVTDINRILGFTDILTEQYTQAQHALMDKVVDMIGQIVNVEHTFYLASGDTIKDFLRGGGKLPNCKYDPTSDEAMYEGAFGFTENSWEDFELVIPITSDETFEEMVGQIFQGMSKLTGKIRYGLAIHELTEMTLFYYVKQKDVHWRWFTDGVADAVTYELLRRHFGQEDAAEWANRRNISDYNDIEKEINLMYWMHGPYDVDTALEYESRLSYARYAYAMYEAQRLIKKHGLGCLRKIINEVRSKRDRRSEDLFQAIKEVTGEDIQDRLCRYQTFGSREEGIEKYNRLFEEAREQKDYEQMFISLLRRLELSPSPFLLSSLKIRKDISNLLFKLGYEETGDRTMLRVLEKLKKPAFEPIYDYFSELFLDYALECDNPQKGEEIAKEVLSKNPYSCAAITVRMRLLSDSGNLDEAKTIAKKVLVLAGDNNSIYGQAALEVLRLKPANSGYINK